MAVSNPDRKVPTERVTTGVPGLDLILQGGLPKDRIYLIEGFPGTGKTTVALQFLLEGARKGEVCLYVTLSETKAELEQVAASHGWSLKGVDLFELETVSGDGAEAERYTIFPAAEVELSETTSKIFEYIRKHRPKRVVFDSLSEVRLLAGDPLRYRRQILALKQFFIQNPGTVLLLDDRTTGPDELQLHSLCHGVIELEETTTDHASTTSRLKVIKLRGVAFDKGYHDYEILHGGLHVYPRLIASKERGKSAHEGQARKESASGIPALDQLLGGGISHGSSVLVLGPAGTGKSSISTQLAWNALKRGEHVACYLFEESENGFMKRTLGIGQDFRPYREKGQFTIRQMDPSRISPGNFNARVKADVEERRSSVVVIDSLTGYLNAMPTQKHLLLHMHELLSYLCDHDVLSILVMAQHGFLANMEQSADVSYLADTVILLRYFEAKGRVLKAISVVKKRHGTHENTIREFKVTSTGLQIGEPLEAFQGVLTGVPKFQGESKDLMESSK